MEKRSSRPITLQITKFIVKIDVFVPYKNLNFWIDVNFAQNLSKVDEADANLAQSQ